MWLKATCLLCAVLALSAKADQVAPAGSTSSAPSLMRREIKRHERSRVKYNDSNSDLQTAELRRMVDQVEQHHQSQQNTAEEPPVLKQIYYINLRSSTERRHRFLEALSSANLGVEVARQEAVSMGDVASGFMDAAMREFRGIGTRLQKSAKAANSTAACLLSHVEVLKKAQRLLNPSEVALVLEDDADVPANLSSTIPMVLKTAPHGWDVLKICAWGDTREEDSHDDSWYRVRGSLFEPNGGILYGGSCGYMVSGASVKRVLRHLHDQAITDMDAALFSDASNEEFAINTYQLKATLIKLSDDHKQSTIYHQGLGSDYSTQYTTVLLDTVQADTVQASSGASHTSGTGTKVLFRARSM